jgi:hypothetical protein
VYQNAVGSNATQIKNIWTNGNVLINTFDVSPGDLAGLALILKDEQALSVSASKTLTGTTP